MAHGRAKVLQHSSVFPSLLTCSVPPETRELRSATGLLGFILVGGYVQIRFFLVRKKQLAGWSIIPKNNTSRS